jgi:hypothetical protein
VKPSRRALVVMIARIQNTIGEAMQANNDRNPNRADETAKALDRAHGLCIDATHYEIPVAEHEIAAQVSRKAGEP